MGWIEWQYDTSTALFGPEPDDVGSVAGVGFLPRPFMSCWRYEASESTCVSAYVQMQRRFGYGTDRGEALRSLVTFACRRSPAARKKIKLTSGLLSS